MYIKKKKSKMLFYLVSSFVDTANTNMHYNQNLRLSDIVEDEEVETTFPSTTSSTTVMTLVLEVELEVVLTL